MWWASSGCGCWGFPNGVWRSSGQLGHYTGFHGNAIFLEVMGRRVPEPEPEQPEPEPEQPEQVQPEPEEPEPEPE